MFVELVINRPISAAYTYGVEDKYIEDIEIGKRVEIEFHGKKEIGAIIGIKDSIEFDTKKLKYIRRVIDKKPLFDDYHIKLAKWMSTYYICTMGEALFSMLPTAKRETQYKILHATIEQKVVLSDEQKKATDDIKSSIYNERGDKFLIYGITGSGKTEVYKEAARYAVSLGYGVIILVPEISLTPQTQERFYSIFGNRIAIIHSRLTAGEKLYNWRRLQRGEAVVVLGARSAIFAPVKNPGLIIIDEEHESSYKSSDTPRYHARQVAMYLSKRYNITLVLGSATPQIESYYHALKGNLKMLKLKKRYGKFQEHNIRIIEFKFINERNFLSEEFVKNIIEAKVHNKQSIVFINRRGFSSMVYCLDCGNVIKCPNCDISLTYHKMTNIMSCHYCGYSTMPPDKCPVCGGERLKYSGIGTEHIVEYLKETFPQLRIERFDLDTTRKKGSYEKILNRFKDGEIDILIGTQMITKGLHFPNVSFVGVITIDNIINLPDFRSCERAFALLMQVAGRAGRGESKGNVIIQTINPDHFVMDALIKQDYEYFAQREIEVRKQFSYPPFVRMARIVIRSHDIELAKKTAGDIKKISTSFPAPGIKLMGPAPCPFTKINKNYRYHIIFKSTSIKPIQRLIKSILNRLKVPSKVYLEIDIDPMSLL